MNKNRRFLLTGISLVASLTALLSALITTRPAPAQNLPSLTLVQHHNLKSAYLKINDEAVVTEVTERGLDQQEIYVPLGVKGIGRMAFHKCKNLKRVILPPTLTEIDDNAFLSCHKLEKINFPVKLTSIGVSAFSGCSSLATITLPNSVTWIGSNAFGLCKNLKRVTLSNLLTEINVGTFTGCDKLQKIDLPDGITKISAQAFMGCKNLQEIYLPPNVREIGNQAFTGCERLMTIYVSSDAVEKLVLNSNSNVAEGAIKRNTLSQTELIPNLPAGTNQSQEKEKAAKVSQPKIKKQLGVWLGIGIPLACLIFLGIGWKLFKIRKEKLALNKKGRNK